MTLLGKVTEIWRYPVSSMGGERMASASLEPAGIPGDRLWGVTDLRNGDVAAPEKRRHWRPLPNLFSRIAEGEPQIGRDGSWETAGSEAADALLSRFLGFPAALRAHSAYGGEEPGQVAPRYARANLHIVTTASMRHLASLLPDAGQVDPRRFRPNIVIETEDGFEGFVEHRIVGRTIAIGDTRIAVSEPCARCSFTALAQGELAFEPAVLQAIAHHGEGGFGALCAIVQPGEIRLGDDVRLDEA